MKALLWQWGRFGAGPRLGLELAHALRSYTDVEPRLSLSAQAELLHEGADVPVDLPVSTYRNQPEFLLRSLWLHKHLGGFLKQVEDDKPAIALCVMAGYWDAFVAARLQRLRIPVVSIIHDAVNRSGERFQIIHGVQRRLIGSSGGIITLSRYVMTRLKEDGLLNDRPHWVFPHPALEFSDLDPPRPGFSDYAAQRPLRLLLPGRLQAYKGPKLLLEAMRHLSPDRVALRLAGPTNDPRLLDGVRDMPNIKIQSGWCREKDLVAHIDWADVIVAPYIQASQSGIIPLAFSRQRPVITTPVGGLPEQVAHGKNGLIADEISVPALVHAIELFAADPSFLRRCAAEALRTARTDWAWSTVAPQIAAALADVCGVRRPVSVEDKAGPKRRNNPGTRPRSA